MTRPDWNYTDAERTAQILDDTPSCVGRATGVDGCPLAAWVITSSTWRGHPRYTPKVERRFVSWRTLWQGYRRRSFVAAERQALRILHRFDADGLRKSP